MTTSTPTDLTQCTALQLLGLYRSGAASPVDTTHALLARIEKVNPQINAFTLVDEDVALACAKASEIKWHAHRHPMLVWGRWFDCRAMWAIRASGLNL